jgi:hypothetical protein
MPGQIRPETLPQRSGRGKSKLLVDGCQFDLLKAASLCILQRENLTQKGEKVGRRISIYYEASRGRYWQKRLWRPCLASRPAAMVSSMVSMACVLV